MSIIDKVCGKMGLLDPEDEKMNLEDETLGHQPEARQAEGEDRMGLGREDGSRNVVDFHSAASARENVVNSIKMKVIVIEPKTLMMRNRWQIICGKRNRSSSILKRQRQKMPSVSLTSSAVRPMR